MDSKYQSIFSDFGVIFRDRGKFIMEEVKNCQGLQKGQFGVLFKVVKNPGITQKEISALLNINKGTTTRAIQKLKDMDMVRIEKDPKDNRNHFVYPTEKGQELKKEIEEISNTWIEKILDGISKEEIEHLSHILQKIRIGISEKNR